MHSGPEPWKSVLMDVRVDARAWSFAVKTLHMGEKEGEKEAKTKTLRCVRRADFPRRTCLGDGEEKVCREIFT